MTKPSTPWLFAQRWPKLARRSLLKLAGAAAIAPAGAALGADQGASKIKPSIWTVSFAGQSVWGYADKHSVSPGEGFDLMLATGPTSDGATGRVEFFRIGAGGQHLVWTSRDVKLVQRPVLRTAATVGANWPPSLVDIDTSSWPPGYYSADFVEATTGRRELQVAQIVVTNPHRTGTVLLKLSTNTYQAYNGWGGHSLYENGGIETRGTMVSFDRPTAPTFFEYEIYLARWLEALGTEAGFSVDYAADFDLHRDPGLAEHYPLLISGSHDEYWSKEMFDAVERRILKLGRNVAFFGANAAYWQVRFVDVNRPRDGADLGRQLVTYKDLVDPIARRKTDIDPALLVTARFRDGARRPETMLMGVGFQSWFEPQGDLPRFPYVVADTDLPFFEGTGYRSGDIAADVVGYEWDNRDPQGDGRRLWDEQRSRNALLPAERVKVLFRGTPIDVDGKPGLAEAVYFESPAGAKVFSAGSIRWAWGLGKPGFERADFKRFNANLVRWLLA
ncbi:MAG TPA: N,N-dimethylformamidase beta subunit family domain-containing protein [Stellaceae bacterium]|nr:N,N-dimethylformamidase beta subunit family domain-containing protein [Stellaceae bacterium]